VFRIAGQATSNGIAILLGNHGSGKPGQCLAIALQQMCDPRD